MNLRRTVSVVLSLIFLIFVFGVSLGDVSTAKAVGLASIYLGPASGTFTVGSTFTVSVYLNTGGQSVNAVEVNLKFPADKLQVVSPTAGKSLIQIWVNQPSYSNSEGTLKYQGAIPTPGINTEAGLISTVTFRVKDTGTATVRILDSSRVLLNDGRGTDFLSQTTNGVYSLILPPPAGPIVTSPTNLDQNKWYANKSAVLKWEAAPGTTGFSYILNNSPVDYPDDISEGMKTFVAYNNLADGIYYFHIKSLREGSWGGVTSFGIKIDNTPPAVFDIEISPSDSTTNRKPLISFDTTDQNSGIDHFELKIISLDKPASGTSASLDSAPFFIEVVSPYAQELELGRYDVVVRAFDQAGNFYQATKRLEVTNKLFDFVKNQGLKIGGSFVISWTVVWIFSIIIIILLGFLARFVWIWHRKIEHQLEAGPMRNPDLAEKIKELKEKQKDYGVTNGGPIKSLIVFGLVFLVGLGMASSVSAAGATTKNDNSILIVEPPIISLFPTSISNDEILYVGGSTNIQNGEIIIYLQNIESGSAISQNVKADSRGTWFYSFPTFLDSGKYQLWTQLKAGEELSPPSPRIELEVAPTAVQVGGSRISFEKLYLTFLLILLIISLILIIWIVYHWYHRNKKRGQLLKEIKEAEESVRRGFLVLRRDIEAEINLIGRAKMSRELAVEEKIKEEKLLKDLDSVNSYIGKEVWDIEKEV
ncbi:MAG: cohesin domain-containing protein [Candidatus Paceibacterota bacterium]|jgi:hypothetical protein